MHELVDPVLLLVAVSARTALHPPVLSYPMRTRFWETNSCNRMSPTVSANLDGRSENEHMTDGLSELLDDLPGPGDVLDVLDDQSDLDDLLDDLSDGLDDLLDSLPSPTTDQTDD